MVDNMSVIINVQGFMTNNQSKLTDQFTQFVSTNCKTCDAIEVYVKGKI